MLLAFGIIGACSLAGLIHAKYFPATFNLNAVDGYLAAGVFAAILVLGITQ